jgi:hypothetical protein
MLAHGAHKGAPTLSEDEMSEKYDKRAIMRDAHKRYRYAKSRGWDEFTFARCLSTAWEAQKLRRGAARQRLAA